MRTFRETSKGSASVEAALIIPLVMLTIAVMFSIGLRMLQKVKINAETNRAYAQDILYPLFPAENALRIKWIGIQLLENINEEP